MVALIQVTFARLTSWIIVYNQKPYSIINEKYLEVSTKLESITDPIDVVLNRNKIKIISHDLYQIKIPSILSVSIMFTAGFILIDYCINEDFINYG
jgi:hypothetical protein